MLFYLLYFTDVQTIPMPVNSIMMYHCRSSSPVLEYLKARYLAWCNFSPHVDHDFYPNISSGFLAFEIKEFMHLSLKFCSDELQPFSSVQCYSSKIKDPELDPGVMVI
jgi:hypothetical protein